MAVKTLCPDQFCQFMIGNHYSQLKLFNIQNVFVYICVYIYADMNKLIDRQSTLYTKNKGRRDMRRKRKDSTNLKSLV